MLTMDGVDLLLLLHLSSPHDPIPYQQLYPPNTYSATAILLLAHTLHGSCISQRVASRMHHKRRLLLAILPLIPLLLVPRNHGHEVIPGTIQLSLKVLAILSLLPVWQ